MRQGKIQKNWERNLAVPAREEVVAEARVEEEEKQRHKIIKKYEKFHRRTNSSNVRQSS